MWKYQSAQSIKMTEDKAKTLMAPVYMNRKVTKQLGNDDTPHLGWGTPQSNPLTTSSATCSHPTSATSRGTFYPCLLPLLMAKQPLLHHKHMWTTQWDG